MGEWHGTNAFIRAGDRVFRTYFVNSRGDEVMGGTWAYLDITALGRQEEWEDSPEGYPQTPPYKWWKWHDTYGDGATGMSRSTAEIVREYGPFAGVDNVHGVTLTVGTSGLPPETG